jgi:hypothetical protein
LPGAWYGFSFVKNNSTMLRKNFTQSTFFWGLAILLSLAACKRNKLNETNDVQAEATELRTRAENARLSADLPPTCGVSSVNHFITLQYAYQLVDNYRMASRVPGRICQLFDQGGWVLAETFPATVIQAILNQPGICSFRVYNGLDTDRRQHIVIVGVDQYGRDVLSRNQMINGVMPDNPETELIVEMGAPCPQACTGVYTGGN